MALKSGGLEVFCVLGKPLFPNDAGARKIKVSYLEYVKLGYIAILFSHIPLLWDYKHYPIDYKLIINTYILTITIDF